MSLPARNLPVRILYSLAMITMVTFLAWEAWAPLSDSSVYVASTDQNATEMSTQTVTEYTQPETSQLTTAATRNVRALHILGVSTRIYLDDQVDWQIEEHWRRFASSAQASQLVPTEPVFAIYTDFNSSQNSVMLTLGPAVARGNNTLTIEPGNYKTFRNSTVLQAWESIDNDEAAGTDAYLFQTDFEQWQLDKNFQPAAVTAFIGMHQE